MNQFAEINAFVAVVEKGSFSAAARQLGIAKSAVSKKISSLESRLGVLLLNRTTRKLNLTEAGYSFYERARNILSDLEEAEALVSSESAALKGTLRVAAPMSFGVRHLSPAIHEFANENTGLMLDLHFNDRKVNVIEDGFDVAIRIGELQDSALVARPIAPVKMLLCASPEYLHIWGEPQKPSDLLRHQCLSYSNASRQWRFYNDQDKAFTVTVPIRMRANNGDVLLDAAISGMGVLLMPTFIIHKALAEKRLKPIMTDYQAKDINAYAIYPKTRYLSYRVRKFIDFLVDRFGDEPYWDQDYPS